MTTHQKEQTLELEPPDPMGTPTNKYGGESACERSEAVKATDARSTASIGALNAALLRPYVATGQTPVVDLSDEAGTSVNAESGYEGTTREPVDTDTASGTADTSCTSPMRVAMLRVVPQKQSAVPPDAIDSVQSINHALANGKSRTVLPDIPGAARTSALQAALLRPYLTTEEAAELLRVQPQTLRKAWSQRGAYGTLKPYKVKGIRRLYWPTNAVRRLIEGEGA